MATLIMIIAIFFSPLLVGNLWIIFDLIRRMLKPE
jgi:hypothetical protein